MGGLNQLEMVTVLKMRTGKRRNSSGFVIVNEDDYDDFIDNSLCFRNGTVGGVI